MLSITGHARRGLSRALLVTSASALMLGVGFPGLAHASASSSAGKSYEECYDYNYKRQGNYYYEYCYGYEYRDRDHDGHADRNERYYKDFELNYYYYDSGGSKRYDSCYYSHDFGFGHGSEPWKKYCDYNDDRDHDGHRDRDGHEDFQPHHGSR